MPGRIANAPITAMGTASVVAAIIRSDGFARRNTPRFPGTMRADFFSDPAAVASYAERKGWTLQEAERWLSSNLGYDPED